ncbi:MAG: GyrI-like domain-containing protein [Dehalococcoidia bacterium]
MEIVDLKSEWRALYTAKRTPALLKVPRRTVIAVDGEGAPAGEAFQHAVQALYGVAYTAKFTLKKAGIADFPVMPLEAQWEPGALGWMPGPGEAWRWTALIAVPDLLTARMVRSAAAAAAGKQPNPALAAVAWRSLPGGLAAQVMHVGPYAAEPPTVEVLHAFIADQGCRITGRHQEIYLSDPRRTAPERLRTIIRYAVRRSR